MVPFKQFLYSALSDDSGIAIGAAIIGSEEIGDKVKREHQKNYIYTGSKYNNEEIIKCIKRIKIEIYRDNKNNWSKIADLISKGNLIGIFSGKSEFGQRALGNRSIVGDPRKSETKNPTKQSCKIQRKDLDLLRPLFLENIAIRYLMIMLISFIWRKYSMLRNHGKIKFQLCCTL